MFAFLLFFLAEYVCIHIFECFENDAPQVIKLFPAFLYFRSLHMASFLPWEPYLEVTWFFVTSFFFRNFLNRSCITYEN